MMKSKKIDKLWALIIFLLLTLTVIIAHPVKAAGSTRVDLTKPSKNSPTSSGSEMNCEYVRIC